jgi:hypothetical protein
MDLRAKGFVENQFKILGFFRLSPLPADPFAGKKYLLFLRQVIVIRGTRNASHFAGIGVNGSSN